MSASTPAGSSYTIDDGDARAPAPALTGILDAAGTAVAWQRPPPPDCTVAGAGWLQPHACAPLAVAGSAAVDWLEQAPPGALEALAADGPLAVLAMREHVERIAALLPPTIALGAIAADPADTLHALREALLLGSAPSQTVYGVLAEVFALGVLIVGPAGVGKSELALELLARGHRLVADDAVELHGLPGALLSGSAPPLLRGFLEVRGLGVLDVRRMFGEAALVTRRRVDFLLELLPVRDAPTDYRARLAGLRGEARFLGRTLPTICLPIRVGHNLATLVEAACRDQWLRLEGYRADDAFAERQQRAIDAQVDEP